MTDAKRGIPGKGIHPRALRYDIAWGDTGDLLLSVRTYM
jgi:hypothetical protein